MTYILTLRRTLLTFGLGFAGLAGSASAQDLYKSRAEMYHAEAASKQANATIISALADYGKAEAEVAKASEEIREKRFQNELMETEVYYKKRARYEEYQAAHRRQATSADEYNSRARRAAPERLTSYQFASKAGDLRWPTLLMAAPYDATRREIDELLMSRTPDDSGTGSQNCVDIAALLDELKAALRRNIERYRIDDYIAARKFLHAVALEAQEPVFSISQTADKVAGR